MMNVEESNWSKCQNIDEKRLFYIVQDLILYGPRQANLVLIAYASSEGSGEPAHPRSLAGCAGLPELPLLAHTSSESRGTFRQKARSLAPLNGWACAIKICHDGMLEDTNSLDGAHIIQDLYIHVLQVIYCLCIISYMPAPAMAE